MVGKTCEFSHTALDCGEGANVQSALVKKEMAAKGGKNCVYEDDRRTTADGSARACLRACVLGWRTVWGGSTARRTMRRRRRAYGVPRKALTRRRRNAHTLQFYIRARKENTGYLYNYVLFPLLGQPSSKAQCPSTVLSLARPHSLALARPNGRS
jgi:hypothetical protein